MTFIHVSRKHMTVVYNGAAIETARAQNQIILHADHFQMQHSFLFMIVCGIDGYVNNDGSVDDGTSAADKDDGDMVEEGITCGMTVVDIEENVT